MTDVQVRVYRDPMQPAVTAQDPWWTVKSPTVPGAYTAFRIREEAVEFSARLYLRLGAVCTVDLTDGLPA